MSFALAAVAITACQKEIEQPIDEEQVLVSSHVSFYAEAGDPATRATLTTEDNKSFKAAWENTDQISLYATNLDAFDETKPATWNADKGCFDAAFEKVAPTTPGTWKYKAVYPYTADGNIPFGTNRVQNGNAYNSAYDVMYGTVDYDNALLGKDNNGNVFVIPMHRLTGIAYFNIKGGPVEDVVSATLEATGIAAESVAIASDGASVTPSSTLNSITITFAEGTAPKASDLKLWFNVLPGSYEGLKLTINTATKTAVLNSNKQLTYTAGKLNKAVLSGLKWNDKVVVENFSSSKATDDNYNCNSSLITAANRSDFDYTWTPSGSGTVFNNGIKLGSSTATGSVTSEDIISCISNNSTFTVKVYAAVWNTDAGQIKATYNGQEIIKAAANDPIRTTTGAYSSDAFSAATEFVFTKVENGGGLSIASSSKRIIIDKIEILAGGEMPIIETLTVTPDPNNPETVSYEGDVLNYIVTTANIESWTATSNNDAFVVEIVDGGFKVIVAANEATTGRNATITVAGGSKSETVTITQEASPAQAQSVTIAEFLAKEVNTTDWYQLTGEITEIVSSTYGNINVKDETGTVYVYGLTATQQTSNDKSFASIGLVVGDIVTFNTLRSEHNNNPQAGGTIPAYYVSHRVAPSLSVSPNVLTFAPEGGSLTITATTANFVGTVTLTATSDNNHFTTSIDGNTITVTAAENTGTASINGTLTVTATDGTDTMIATVTLTQNKPVPPAQKGDVLWAESFSGFTNGEVPSVSNDNTTVFGNGTVPYLCTDGSSETKVFATGDMLAGGDAPELLISKNNGSFSITGIPTGSAEKMTLTFKTNRSEIIASSLTTGVTIDNSNYDSDNKLFTVLISANSSVSNFSLVLSNPASNNGRVDDFSLVVGQKEIQNITFGDGKRIEWTFGINCNQNEAKQGLTVSGAKTDVTYESSDNSIATVTNSGMVTPLKAGEITITATAAENSDYFKATDSYTLVIIDPSSVAIEYSFTITENDFTTTSYADNNKEKMSVATATDGSNNTMNVHWTSYQVYKNSNVMQWQKSTGAIYNSTDLGTIESVTVNKTDGSFTTYYGTTVQPSSGTTVGNGFFQVKVGNALGKTTSIVVVFKK